MLSSTLRINQNNLKNELEENYFYYLDVFHRCLLVSLVLHHNTKENVLESTIMENAYYSQMLVDLDSRFKKGYNIIEDINSKTALDTFLDVQVYLEEFIGNKHNSSGTNIYNLTIDHEYNIVITNKRLGKRYAF